VRPACCGEAEERTRSRDSIWRACHSIWSPGGSLSRYTRCSVCVASLCCTPPRNFTLRTQQLRPQQEPGAGLLISLYRRTPFSSLDMHNHAHSAQSCTYTCHVHTHTHTHTCNVPLSAVLQAADPSHALYSLASQAFKHLPSCPQDTSITHTHTHTQPDCARALHIWLTTSR
jgi:hypothetical protein